MDLEQQIQKILNIELPVMSRAIQDELKAQGHNNTGSLIRSFEVVVERKGSKITGGIKANFYLEFLNTGVRAANIPFQRGSGRKSSKYIDSLIDYFRTKGLSAKESKSAAFATAVKHKREGMPTKASKRFSKTGKRTGAVNIAVDKTQDKVIQKLEDEFGRIISLRIEQPFRDLQINR